MTIALLIGASAAPPPDFWGKVLDDPKNLFAAISAAIAIIAIFLSTATFLATQMIQQKFKRAETMQKLMEWFSTRKEDDAIKAISRPLVYGTSWTFYRTDLETDKEKGLARLLSTLNHLAFYVDIGLIKAKDLSYSEAGYYFSMVISNNGVQRYLNHVAAHDATLGMHKDVGFYYLRKYGSKISNCTTLTIEKGELELPPAGQVAAPAVEKSDPLGHAVRWARKTWKR